MKKVYYLSTCTTCERILKDTGIDKRKDFIQQDIKTEKITPAQLDEMKRMAGSYEALFSRIALKFRSMGLNKLTLTEKDYRRYILEEYTFLKRPVTIIGNEIFIGNSPKNVDALKEEVRNTNNTK
ncbi:MAG TPA: ArsC/Spx/MgsR family protein [Bacteroidia bacterium]|nr:ArsC/Spx/MgsR family protein [Bacteroidia bacterium]